jgi:cell division septal protein FtsQ
MVCQSIRQHSGGTALKILRFVLAFLVLALSVYALTANDYTYSSLSTLFLSGFFAVSGVEELQKNSKSSSGYLFISVAIFILIMALFSF